MANRLPMPDEKPSSIWRPRQYKPSTRWLPIYPQTLRVAALWLTALAVIAAALAIWRALGVPVTVLVNGEPVTMNTHRRTVAGAIRLAGVKLDETVYVAPSPDTRLERDMVITVGALRPVIVHADGQTRVAPTHETDPRLIAQELGISVGPRDAVIVERALRPTRAEIAEHPALADAPALPREIRVVRPHLIIVREVTPLAGTETTVSFETTAPSLGRALIDAGYALYEADRITPALDTRIEAPLEVTIERAIPVTLRADGHTYHTRTHASTAGALLDDYGLALTGGDYSLPSLDSPLSAGQTVQIVRVRVEETIEEESIPFETVYVPDPDLVLDQQRVLEPGEEGVLARRVRVRREDGAAVSRVVDAEWTARRPRPEVIGYGIQINIRTLDTPYGPLRYWRKLHVLATSYSPLTAGHKQPGDPFFGLSATGTEVVRGIVATDPRVIPLGTNLYVPNYGTGEALDVGGAVKGFRIDLGYDDANLVLWNTWVDVYLLLPVPPSDEMVWVLPGQ